MHSQPRTTNNRARAEVVHKIWTELVFLGVSPNCHHMPTWWMVDDSDCIDDPDHLHSCVVVQANLPGPEVDGCAQSVQRCLSLCHPVHLERFHREALGHLLRLLEPLYISRVFDLMKAHAGDLALLRFDHGSHVSFVRIELLHLDVGRDFFSSRRDGTAQGSQRRGVLCRPLLLQLPDAEIPSATLLALIPGDAPMASLLI